MTNPADEIYYDPYDAAIDADPHPVWRRMREEAPLYRNEKYDFWALSRFEDVDAALQDWRTYSSAKGTLLELIKSVWTPPSGLFIFEDRLRPVATLHSHHEKLMRTRLKPSHNRWSDDSSPCGRLWQPEALKRPFRWIMRIF